MKVLEGIENVQNSFIYIKNDKDYEIVLPGSNLTEADIQEFAIKIENTERTIAILTIARRSGEGVINPKIKATQELCHQKQK